MKRMLVFILALVVTGIALFPQTVRITAKGVDKGPRIDGLLDDQVWQQSEVFTDFKMIKPDPGRLPSEKTVLRVLVDRKNLFIGVYCYSTDPRTIAITNLQHDQADDGDDLIRILLDPFQDKRNAYIFVVNAKGARADGLAQGERYNTNWDGVWEAKSRILPDGWSTEIKIPFKTISFHPHLQEWGFNVERYIPVKIETIRMSGISRDSFFFNPAEAGLLAGITGIRQGMGLTVKPYVTSDMGKDYMAGDGRNWELNGGFDIYKNFTPNLVGIFTYQTDFAETEVDERQINLTRFPLYFREKRAFFLEGSDLFTFGTAAMHQPIFEPFFSRRIGLYEQQPVPIDWGAKVYGKIGHTNIAFLNVRTRSMNGVPSGNFAAGRVYQNIFRESKVGLIFTSGQPGSRDSNRLFGLDFTYSTSRFLGKKNFNASGWWVHNWNQNPGDRHYGWGFGIGYPNDLFDVSLSYYYFGDALEPGLGFLPRGNIQHLNTKFQFKPRPQKGLFGRWVRQWSLESYGRIYWNLNGDLESSRISVAPFTIFNTESGDRIEYFRIFHREILPEAFEVAENVVIPLGDYRYRRHQFNLHSANHRAITLDVEYEFGGFYSGELSQLKLETGFNFKGNVRLGLEGVFIHGNLPEGNFKTRLYRIKTDLYMNPDLGLMTFLQYDSETENLGMNLRFKWRLSPGNTIYLVYNKSWEKGYDVSNRYRLLPDLDRGVFKIQLSWRP